MVLKCFVEHNWFHLIGIICGLAIYNFTVVDLHFPLALYKKLLNVKPCLEDLKELSPTEGRYEKQDLHPVWDGKPSIGEQEMPGGGKTVQQTTWSF